MTFRLSKVFCCDVTGALVLVNVLAFIAMIQSSGDWRNLLIPNSDLLVRWGANLGAFTVNGEYWRLLTSTFVHANIMHLTLNMYALWTFGPSVEKVFGPGNFLLIYIISGLSGALASTVWNPAQTSAGASGALCGIAGAMLASMLREKKTEAKQPGTLVRPLIFFAVICGCLLYGFFLPGIDNAAHIGGLACGFLYGLVVDEAGNRQSRAWGLVKTAAVLATSLVIAVACLIQAKNDKRSSRYQVLMHAIAELKQNHFEAAYAAYDELLKSELAAGCFVGRARALIGMKQFDKAMVDCNKAIAMSPKDPMAYRTRSMLYHDQGNDIEAIQDITLAVKLSKNSQNIKQASLDYNNRAWYEIALGRFNEALSDANHSLNLDPDQANTIDTRGLAYYCLRKPDKALADYERSIELKPKDGAGYFHRAMIYDQIGETDRAKQEKERGIKLGYKPEPWELKLPALFNKAPDY